MRRTKSLLGAAGKLALVTRNEKGGFPQQRRSYCSRTPTAFLGGKPYCCTVVAACFQPYRRRPSFFFFFAGAAERWVVLKPPTDGQRGNGARRQGSERIEYLLPLSVFSGHIFNENSLSLFSINFLGLVIALPSPPQGRRSVSGGSRGLVHVG